MLKASYKPKEADNRKLSEALFFAQILQKDIKTSPIKSNGGVTQTAVSGTSGVASLQLCMEKLVATFVVDDSVENADAAAVVASQTIAAAGGTMPGPFAE
ncbi:hypothetical protein BN946_scf184910.g28 [Trametes cinnabarina]|uniref:Uncharacterized protein n=1 Tax=Pycnoporus cinnabarinus TaxID=5643 RepID=A0A060SH13_PYCCI|nr:hypothetical protein BN946_scf184910.g28 [Trametes cinnabarina]